MSGFGDNSYSYVEHQRMLRETFGMDAASKAAYLDGLMAGMMGFPADHLTGAALVGYATGSAGKAKSEELRKRKVEAGKRSAEARNEKNGSSDPRANREQNVNTVPNAVPESVPENREQNVNVGRKEGRKEEEQVLQTNLSVNAARDRSASPGSGSADAGNNSRSVLADAETMTPEQIRAIPMPRPTRAQFLAYARLHWPEWHQPKVGSIYADLSAKGWTLDGKPVHDWTKLLRKLRSMADPAHIGERLPIGSITRTVAPDLSSMRFQA